MGDKAPTVEERISELENKIAQQDKTIQQQSKHIDTLTKQLEKSSDPEKAKKLEKPKLPEQEFTVDKRKFKFVIPEFQWKGQKVTALDALNDKELLAELVKIGAGVIRELH